MKILSHQEYEFLKNPDKFNRNYQYVLTHRIKKKFSQMENTISFINYYQRALLTDKKKGFYDDQIKKEKWHKIVLKAMVMLSKNKDERYKRFYEKFNKDSNSTTDIDKWNEILYEYQRNIVKLYLGEEYLQYESH